MVPIRAGEHLWESRDRDMFKPQSCTSCFCLRPTTDLPSHKGNTIMEIYCVLCSVVEKRRSRSGDAKSRGRVRGNGNAHKCKNGFCLFFSLSIKHRRLMQFHSQVWFTLAPIHCLRGSWRLRIFTLSNYQPLCPPTGLVNPFSTFLGVTECISAALSLIFGEHVAGEPSQH